MPQGRQILSKTLLAEKERQLELEKDCHAFLAVIFLLELAISIIYLLHNNMLYDGQTKVV